MHLGDAGFLAVVTAAVLAPLLARGLDRWVRVPIVVFELVLGIAIGPAVLDLVEPSEFVERMSDFGLAVLFFVAGNEIDARVLRGRGGTRAVVGWLVSLAAAVAVGFLVDPGAGAIVIGIALSSTALGALMPILRDSGQLETPFGRAVTAVGAVGEFGPLIAISLFLGGRGLEVSSVVLLIFVVLAGAVLLVAQRVPHGRLHGIVTATLHTSGQFAVRVIVFIIAALVALSLFLDLDMLLGAFAAGMVWQLIMRNAPEPDRREVQSKVEAVAFGLLVPVFFVTTGVTFDLDSLISDARNLALVPILMLLLLVVRGLPSMLAAPPGAPARERLAVALLGATGLPIIVAVTAIGVDEGVLSPAVAAALVGAGMLSVLLFPLAGMALRGVAPDTPVERVEDDDV